MNIEINTFNLCETIRVLKIHNALPGNIEITPIGENGFYLASAFDFVDSDIITESVSTALDSSAKLATIKALVEYVERRAIQEGKVKGLTSCKRKRSEGTAAYPSFVLSNCGNEIIGNDSSRKLARENAYFECLERYVWSKWWEMPDIGHKIITLIDEEKQAFFDIDNISNKFSIIIDSIKKHTPIRNIKAIYPSFEVHLKEYEPIVLILIAELEGGGFIPGGAAGRVDDVDHIYLRAFSELYRHSIAISRIKEQGLIPLSQYENRLSYFGFGKGDLQIRNRVIHQGPGALILPELDIDEEIVHSLSKEITVYKCLFKDMPQFIDYRIDIFCI